MDNTMPSKSPPLLCRRNLPVALSTVAAAMPNIDCEVVGDEGDNVPRVGMEFESAEEVWEFYKRYAVTVGFPIRKRTSRKGDDGMLKYVTYTCSREGGRCYATTCSLKPQPTIQTGCKARLTAHADILGTWRVSSVYLEHNHTTSPSKARLYRCNRNLSEHVKRKLEVNDIAGIPLHKSFNSAVVEAGGYSEITFIEKDCRNYIEKVRRLRLGDGDAVAIQAYFTKMQANCPGFFFSVDLDEDSRLRNVFWADNRCREAYKEFGDIVTFDTTYLTNKYDMPFAPFVGVNNHGQSILFGCGLISNEDTDTFVWLFSTWLQCMGNQPPTGIITDQDRAMKNAIEIVFPSTRHRWCLWHIMKKLPEKFGGILQKGAILAAIHDVVYESQTIKEFDDAWNSMIETYNLDDDDWLSGLYVERSRWVPCFLKMSFWAGMSTTQRSESINAFFDGYVHSKTSLKQFVEQYERALKAKVEKEFEADYKSFAQMIPCATVFDMERQFQDVYTISKFKEFQEELTGKLYCEVVSSEMTRSGMLCEVREYIKLGDRMKWKKYKVLFEREKCGINCSCLLFEFRGIMCRHIIALLIREGITSIPDRFILKRWRKDVVRHYKRVKISYNGWITTPGQLQYERLCNKFAEIAHIVADDDGLSQDTFEWLEARLTNLSKLKSRSVCGSNTVEMVVEHLENVSSTQIKDPKCTKTKGAPRKLRKKGPMEGRSKKSKEPSRVNKGKGGHQSTFQHCDSTHAIQEVQYHMPNSLSYTQQLMGAHFQPWSTPYRIDMMPIYTTSQPAQPMHPPSFSHNDHN